MKNKWMVYSGKGASLEQIMNSPPANDAGSCYISIQWTIMNRYWNYIILHLIIYQINNIKIKIHKK